MAETRASKQIDLTARDPGGKRQSRWPWLAAGAVVCVGYLIFQAWYERHALNGPTMRVELICHTEPLQRDDLSVMVFYDKLALSPIARALGLYQNRPPAEVKSFHIFQVDREHVHLTPYSVELAEVPQGPISRIHCAAGGRGYFADVSDRSLKAGTLYVHLD